MVPQPTSVTGLILIDYPPRFPERTEKWLEQALPFARERGIREHVVRRIAAEARHVDLWQQLEGIGRPIMLIKGGQSRAVSDDDLQRYRQLPQVRVELFEESGHDVSQPNPGRFMRVVNRFLVRLEADSARTDDA